MGVVHLLDALGHGIRWEDELAEHPVIGIAEALFVMHGKPALLISIPWAYEEDEEIPVLPIRVELINRVEVCVRIERDEDDSISDESYARLEAWIRSEYELDAIAEWEEAGQSEAVPPEADDAPSNPPGRTQEDIQALLDALGAREEDE